MKEMIEGLKLITLANFKKNSKEEFKESIQSLRNLRVKIEILKSYFLIAWESKFISHGFYVEVLEKIEEISKQASKWESWLHSQFK